MDVLSARALSKGYGVGDTRQEVIQGINLSLRAGELTLIMGPSGCGKTTLLSLLGCLMRPCDGLLCVFGKEVSRMSDAEQAEVRRRHMSFVFQHFNLFASLTARENVAMSYRLSGTPVGRAHTYAESLLAGLGLGAHMGKRPRQLSGGQQQRVAIARALAAPGQILLADEPTGALDRESSETTMEMLREAADHGRSVVVVTHDAELEAFADRVVRLDEGRIASDRRLVYVSPSGMGVCA